MTPINTKTGRAGNWFYRRSRADARMLLGAFLLLIITIFRWDSPTAIAIVSGAFLLLGVEGVTYMVGAVKSDKGKTNGQEQD